MILNNRQKRNEPKRKVHVSVEFVRIGEIDIVNERYFAEIVLKIHWMENCEVIAEYDPKKHWNPKIEIENLFVKPEETCEYTALPDGTVIETRKIKGFFWERMELRNFPLDIQELSITLTTKLDSIHLTAKDYTFHKLAKFKFVEQQRWKLLELVDVSNKASHDSVSCESIDKENPQIKNWMETPRTKFTCYAIRHPNYYFENAYFLIFLITVTGLTVFSMDCKLPQNRLQTTATILLTSVSFKWVINRSLPTTNYTTSLDKYSIICIFFLCLLCVWHSLVGVFWQDKGIAKTADMWALIALSIIFVIIQIVFLISFFISYLKIWKLEKKEKLYINNNSIDDTHGTKGNSYNMS